VTQTGVTPTGVVTSVPAPTATATATRTGTATRRSLLHSVLLGLSAGLLATVVALAALLIVVPFVSGSTPMTILTSSMEPHLPPGTLVIVKPTPVDEIRIGDVLTYQIRSGDPAVVSHRVISVNSVSDGTFTFITQGDHNGSPDEKPVIEAQVRGVVWYSVPWVGYLATAVNGENRYWLVPALAIPLLGYAGYMIVSAITGARRKKRRGGGEFPAGEFPAGEFGAAGEADAAVPAGGAGAVTDAVASGTASVDARV
jgi:signal peptidase I